MPIIVARGRNKTLQRKKHFFRKEVNVGWHPSVNCAELVHPSVRPWLLPQGNSSFISIAWFCEFRRRSIIKWAQAIMQSVKLVCKSFWNGRAIIRASNVWNSKEVSETIRKLLVYYCMYKCIFFVARTVKNVAKVMWIKLVQKRDWSFTVKYEFTDPNNIIASNPKLLALLYFLHIRLCHCLFFFANLQKCLKYKKYVFFFSITLCADKNISIVSKITNTI